MNIPLIIIGFLLLISIFYIFKLSRKISEIDKRGNNSGENVNSSDSLNDFEDRILNNLETVNQNIIDLNSEISVLNNGYSTLQNRVDNYSDSNSTDGSIYDTFRSVNAEELGYEVDNYGNIVFNKPVKFNNRVEIKNELKISQSDGTNNNHGIIKYTNNRIFELLNFDNHTQNTDKGIIRLTTSNSSSGNKGIDFCGWDSTNHAALILNNGIGSSINYQKYLITKGGGDYMNLPKGTILMLDLQKAWNGMYGNAYRDINNVKTHISNHYGHIWKLCDGTTYNAGNTNNLLAYDITTPDLRNKFIRGSGVNLNDLGNFGGSDSFHLTVAQLPPHSHGYNDQNGNCSGGNCPYSGGHGYAYGVNRTTYNTGSGQAVTHVPRHYKVVYIIKIL